MYENQLGQNKLRILESEKKMRMNKVVLFFAISAVILSGCSTTEEKQRSLMEEKQGSLMEGELNRENSALTTGELNDGSISGEEMAVNYLGGDGVGAGHLGPEFSDPANPLSKQTVYFNHNSSQIQQRFITVVSAHAQYLLSHPGQKVFLEGHTDEIGSREYNVALGEQRAKSVYRMMKAQGVPAKQIETVSYGEEKSVADGLSSEALQLNRRVEIVYLVRR